MRPAPELAQAAAAHAADPLRPRSDHRPGTDPLLRHRDHRRRAERGPARPLDARRLARGGRGQLHPAEEGLTAADVDDEEVGNVMGMSLIAGGDGVVGEGVVDCDDESNLARTALALF